MHDKKLLFFAACTVCLSSIAAPADSDLQQDAPRQHMLHGGVEYTTELQTNFRGDYNFLNLLRLSADLRLGRGFTFRASTVSTAKTRDESITDDQLDFSNLYVDNTALALALGGVEWSPNEHHTLFVGVHTMNEDCFASEVTSLFTTSSCGINPTVSMNYDIANFPVASLGMHYKYSADRWGLVATLYNGRGYGRFSGRENVFRFCPKDDGLFGVLQGELKPHGSHYFLGLAAHYGQLGTLPERRLRPHFGLMVNSVQANASRFSLVTRMLSTLQITRASAHVLTSWASAPNATSAAQSSASSRSTPVSVEKTAPYLPSGPPN